MPFNDHIKTQTMNGQAINGNSFHAKEPGSMYEIRSEEVHEIMSKMPHWIIRQGNTVMLAVVMLLFAGAHFIRYPDVSSVQVQINTTATSPNQPVLATASIPGDLAGKLKAGQEVVIKLANYPFHRYGVLQGRVGSVTGDKSQTDNLLRIALENGLTTNTGKHINASTALPGTAEILTANKTILERLFERFR